MYEQLIRQEKNYILTGILREGDKLPSVRTLAEEHREKMKKPEKHLRRFMEVMGSEGVVS